MNANERESIDLVFQDVVGAAYEVGNALGCGYLETVYECALVRELLLRGRDVRRQVRFEVKYKGAVVGKYSADLIVDGVLVVELKCVDRFAPEHMAQCINYLKTSGLHIALLINFQKPKVEWKRIVFAF